MFLEDDTVTVTKEAVKKYGGSGAIILQILYTEYDIEIPMQDTEWKPLFDGIMDMSMVKRIITQLHKKNKIVIKDDTIVLSEKPKRRKKKVEDEPKVEREPNPNWSMATLLCEIVGQSEGFYTQKRYLRLATNLLKEGYTEDFMRKRYLDRSGEWYTYEYKGTMGSPPNTQDIRTTLEKKYNAFTTGGKQTTSNMWG